MLVENAIFFRCRPIPLVNFNKEFNMLKMSFLKKETMEKKDILSVNQMQKELDVLIKKKIQGKGFSEVE